MALQVPEQQLTSDEHPRPKMTHWQLPVMSAFCEQHDDALPPALWPSGMQQTPPLEHDVKWSAVHAALPAH